jgi:hypothetical protein
MMSEIEESYIFLVQSTLQMCPNVKGEDVKVVFGDQFFTPEIV